MSNLWHGPISTNQILAREKRVNRDIFGKPTKQNLWGFLWWINVNKPSIYGSLSIDINFFAHIFPKMACFCQLFWPPKLFTPTGQFFYTDISVISVTFSNSAFTLTFILTFTLTLTLTFTLTFALHLQIDGASSRSIERHFLSWILWKWNSNLLQKYL